MTTAQPLIVPISVDALVVNDTNRQQVLRSTPDFDALAPHGLPEPGNKYDIEADDTDDWGVYVQWELPATLREGRIDATGPGGTRFPLIPNRWLVIRHSFAARKDATGSAPQVRAWLVRGDEQADPADPGVALLPGHPDEGGYPQPVAYGRAHALDTGDTAPPEPGTGPFLTADSTGLPAFCCYQPYNQNILSFHDTLKDLEQAQGQQTPRPEIIVNYLVLGWYSQAAADPLPETTAHQLPDRLAALRWTLPEHTQAMDTAGTLYAGSVLGLPWDRELDPAQWKDADGKRPVADGRPASPTVVPAVGHSTIDAVTALLAQQALLTPDEAALFEAFSYDLLDATGRPHLPQHLLEPATDHALDYVRHDRQFLTLPGGHRWQLTGPEPRSGPPQPAAAPTDAERKALAELNTGQAGYDTGQQTLKDLTARLKGLWWITSPYDHNNPAPPDRTAVSAMKALAARIDTCTTARDLAAGSIPTGTSTEQLARAITDWEKKHGIDTQVHRLQPVPLPPFRRPANPVVALSNLQDKNRSREIDGFLGGRLPVRPTDALPTGIPLVLSTHAQDQLDREDLNLVTPDVRGTLPRLLAEFAALTATVTAAVHGHRSTVSDDDLRKAASGVPYIRWWHQPWRPVFLEWTADIYPAPDTDWAFDPDTDALSRYTHKTGVTRTLSTADLAKLRRTVTGHTFIQSLLENHTLYRLRHAADIRPDNPAYKTLIDKIKNQAWDVQSFTLAGVNETLAGRRCDTVLRTRSANAPQDKDDLTYQPHAEGFYTPAPAVLTRHVDHLPLDASSKGILATKDQDILARGDQTFPPDRAAQMRLTSLTITDAFARTLEILQPGTGHTTMRSPSFEVTDATLSYETKEEKAASDVLDLPPRLHQGARLRFDLLDTATGTPLDELDTPVEGSPVHGWFLATRIGHRHALLCYDPAGTPLFDLHCTDDGPGRCRSLPGSPFASPTDEGFADDHPELHAFLTPLLASGQDNGALAALLQCVQRGLDTITPPSPRAAGNRNLALALGRPCALMTARLRLELDSPPLPAPARLGATTPTPPPDTPWPVRLGDPHLTGDGLLGYFTGTDRTRLHTFQTADAAVDPGHYTRRPTAADITLKAQDPTQPATDTHVTLLACPHNSIQAITDVLPAARLTLPDAVTDRALAALRLALPLGPVLAPTQQPGILTMPQPSLNLAHSAPAWTWQEPVGPTAWTVYATTEPKPTDQAPGPVPEAHTGYLQLAAEPT
ncbi:hypothetical protein [Kitasatospora sp. NPDC008115]|uniref:hypothetical protein n=1 Tax=Kitasatospora sp. NPDC008115 TaxID=3364022 RepID=UPI0036E00F85